MTRLPSPAAAALFTAIFCTSFSAVAFAQGKPVSAQAQAAGYRSVLVSGELPAMSKDMTAHFEYNLETRATLSLELSAAAKQEQIDADTKTATGESMMSQARGAALLLSRYSDSVRMAGFYWALGLGYRQQQIAWRTPSDANDPGQKLALDAGTTMLDHSVVMQGPTGHFRAGYRYVGTDVPMALGLFVGIRHFQGTVHDVSASATGDDATDVTPSTSVEQAKLVRRFETSPEVALELGFVF